MQTPVEMRYAGVVIGRGIIDGPLGPGPLFLATADPMPVGTAMELAVEGQAFWARVERVHEMGDASQTGMVVRVRSGDLPESGDGEVDPSDPEITIEIRQPPTSTPPEGTPVAVGDSISAAVKLAVGLDKGDSPEAPSAAPRPTAADKKKDRRNNKKKRRR